MFESDDVDDLTANTITMLFFTHSIVKIVYFAVRSKLFYKTFGMWNNPNSHPLFAESNARYHQIAVKKMRILLMAVLAATTLSVLSWTTITFIGDSMKKIIDPVTNETTYVEVKRLMCHVSRCELFVILTTLWNHVCIDVTCVLKSLFASNKTNTIPRHILTLCKLVFFDRGSPIDAYHPVIKNFALTIIRGISWTLS